MSSGRSECAVVSLPGSILVFGVCFGGAEVNTTEALSLQSMTFAPGPTMLTARWGCAAFALPQDHSPRRALVARGAYISSFLATKEVLTAAG